MKNYTEPKLEVVTLEVTDVITTSDINYTNFKDTIGGSEYGGHASLAAYEI